MKLTDKQRAAYEEYIKAGQKLAEAMWETPGFPLTVNGMIEWNQEVADNGIEGMEESIDAAAWLYEWRETCEEQGEESDL